jgi:hypothetical protein
VEYLKEAVALDPQRYDAYMGLGQFEYYCGRLAGILQFVLALHGDERKGIEMLKQGASKGTYGAWACKTFLLKILVDHKHLYAEAYPYLKEVWAAFPENYHHVLYVLSFAKAYGLDKPESRELLEELCAQWDKGWRPPSYVTEFPLEATRIHLADYYMAHGEQDKAKAHLAKIDPKAWAIHQ